MKNGKQKHLFDSSLPTVIIWLQKLLQTKKIERERNNFRITLIWRLQVSFGKQNINDDLSVPNLTGKTDTNEV